MPEKEQSHRMQYLQLSCSSDLITETTGLDKVISKSKSANENTEKNSHKRQKVQRNDLISNSDKSAPVDDLNTISKVHFADLGFKTIEVPAESLSTDSKSARSSTHQTDNHVSDFELDNKYCYRHNPRVRCNKMADKQQLTEIQNKLETFSRKEQQEVASVWSTFAKASKSQRELIMKGLISQCCFPQLSLISHDISHLLKIDFLEMLPSELALKILCYLDCQSLCNAAQVSTKWKQLADDDRVWRYMCEQHIDRKCPQCGWGLPLMAVKKLQERSLKPSNKKRRLSTEEDSDVESTCCPKPLWKSDHQKDTLYSTSQIAKRKLRQKRPWKAVYSERYTVERHWRKGFYSLKTFKGHTEGVLCCQFDNNKLLMTGSYDKTVKIWNTDTGELIRTLTGHEMGVKSLVFDDQKLITGGLDATIKIGEQGNKLIVSGSADKTVKVWHVDTRTCYTLRGHSDWVTCVKIHPKSRTLFSASDDSTVKLWDLETNKCIATYGGVDNCGHTAQVQCVIPFTFTEDLVTDLSIETELKDRTHIPHVSDNVDSDSDDDDDDNDDDTPETELEKFVKRRSHLPTHLLTASLDNTIKLWDVRTGKCIRTQFGHIEGVWSIAADTFRIVSGAQDKSIKIWDLQNGHCMHTFTSSSPVTCVGLGDSRVVSGLENGEVKMYCFDCSE
ncbi:hypothetical protein CANINC_001002 [Pichia inconspicua]|uniref:F-box domain-containing protein n=1 Tax=Pichia inconspicua TaxID=52247 RepID=A0A4T0X4M8_9ASCO|nr:hypothetical protein CANINC_001002 [[Candida] inconspicua]